MTYNVSMGTLNPTIPIPFLGVVGLDRQYHSQVIGWKDSFLK